MNSDPASNFTQIPSVSAGDLRRCTAVLEALIAERSLLTQLNEDERRALMTAAGRISRPHKPEERQLVKAFRKAARLERIKKDRDTVAAAEIRIAREAPVFVAPRPALPNGSGASGPELERPRNCYVCKQEYRRLHAFYDSMCPECGDFNYAKRFQTAPLQGRYAVVTGSRVKIGFQAALLLLRAGATVVATTRFPHDAAARYAREADFEQWRERLHVFGLDLRHSPSVEILCRYLNLTLPKLDFLLNNACQTVRRPAGFYTHLIDVESRPFHSLPDEQQSVLKLYEECKGALASSAPPAALPRTATDVAGLAAFHGAGASEGPGMGLRASALMSQVRYTYDDASCGADVFPEGRTDADLQQIDLRRQNSWRMALAEVPTTELLEVQLVNAVAPFILCARLKSLFLKQKSGDQHIVNVSAMEGIFSRGTKTDKHPHTNMAKAALNMMTLTSSRDYINAGIHMNAVDTGWITDEDPAQHAQRKREEHDFQPPLDIVDGAARICDPIFNGLITGEHAWGKFFKDYRPANW